MKAMMEAALQIIGVALAVIVAGLVLSVFFGVTGLNLIAFSFIGGLGIWFVVDRYL